jgi:hypothetical protein
MHVSYGPNHLQCKFQHRNNLKASIYIEDHKHTKRENSRWLAVGELFLLSFTSTTQNLRCGVRAFVPFTLLTGTSINYSTPIPKFEPLILSYNVDVC